MSITEAAGGPAGRPTGTAFLLAQLGAHATGRFADRIAPLGLTPPQGGLLRVIAAEPGRSQHAVAEHLGIHPTRLVALVDDLKGGGLGERCRSTQDRRQHALHLTEHGHATLARLSRASAEHEAELCAALSGDERAQLAGLLRRVADQQDLTPQVHPGFGRPAQTRPTTTAALPAHEEMA